MDFVVGDVVRQGFCFANPNHAAAAICALFPFCWGWGGRWRWVGWLVGVSLCVMLAMTYSRTGMVVFAMEAAVLLWCKMAASKAEAALPHPLRLSSGRCCCVLATAVVVAAIAAWWMWPRMALDGAVMNRPRGLRGHHSKLPQ